MLDDHALQLKFSDRDTSVSNKKATGKEVKANGSKLIIRNVPFEATKKDILELFGTYGQIKRVRVPEKFDNKSHRGFAFVDFLTKQEAKTAYESLASTHLYGRHLVIEWAEDNDSIDALREKAKRGHQQGSGEGLKRVKLSDDEDDENELME